MASAAFPMLLGVVEGWAPPGVREFVVVFACAVWGGSDECSPAR